MHVAKTKEPPRRKFSSFRQSSLPQNSILGCPKPQPILQTPTHVDVGKPPTDYCPFFVVNEEVHISFPTLETTKEKPLIGEHVLQQEVEGEEHQKEILILKEKYVNVYKVSP